MKKPKMPPKIGPESMARKAVPGMAKDWKLQLIKRQVSLAVQMTSLCGTHQKLFTYLIYKLVYAMITSQK